MQVFGLLRHALAIGAGCSFPVTLTSGLPVSFSPALKVLVDHVLATPMAAAGLGGPPFRHMRERLACWGRGGGVAICLNSLGGGPMPDHHRQRLASNIGGSVRPHPPALPFHAQNSVGDLMCRITGDCWCLYKA
jgi:hypothetical protein